MACAAFLYSGYVVKGFVIPVASTARICNCDVIKMCRFPMHGSMAKAAVSSGGDMVIGFIFGMTTYTAGRYVGVIETRRFPRDGAVTVITLPGGL